MRNTAAVMSISILMGSSAIAMVITSNRIVDDPSSGWPACLFGIAFIASFLVLLFWLVVQLELPFTLDLTGEDTTDANH